MFKEHHDFFINPQYAHLTNFIENLPTEFNKGGVLIRQERNTVKCFKIDGLDINVKEFCIPPFFLNRFIYCSLRSPKAVRAYNNAILLNSVGIESPTPIAYLICKQGGMLLKSYFISIQYTHIESDTDFERAELDDKVSGVLSEFGTFTANLHNKGVFHGDYGNGNILINYNKNKPIFILIDTNRMKFGSISLKRGCRDFDRLNLTPQKVAIIAKSYAQERGFDPMQVSKLIQRYQMQLKRKRQIKRLKHTFVQ